MFQWIRVCYFHHTGELADNVIATIPGRPALHGRSFSALDGSTPPFGFNGEVIKKDVRGGVLTNTIEDAFQLLTTNPPPLSLPEIAPLVTPPTNASAPRLQSEHSNRLRSGNAPRTKAAQPSRCETETPIVGRFNPVSTPDLFIPRSATATDTSTSALPTPTSAPRRTYPQPWERCVSSNEDGSQTPNAMRHRQASSESSSIMDRPSQRNEQTKHSKPTKSSERRAFKELPAGWKPFEAVAKLDANDIRALHKHALGQAKRFKILEVRDVDALSKVRYSRQYHSLNDMLTTYRSFANLMIGLSTSAGFAARLKLVAATSTIALANTSARLVSPDSTPNLCSSKKRHLPS